MKAKTFLLFFCCAMVLVSTLAFYFKSNHVIKVSVDTQEALSTMSVPSTSQPEPQPPSPAPSKTKAQTSPKPVILSANDKRAIHLASQTKGLDPKVLSLALTAHQEAKSRGLVQKPYLVVIDYTKPSVDKRLWIYDLDESQLVYELHVTHGEFSGKDKPSKFSNKKDSHQTSLGVYTTAETYKGMYGLSLKLDGHEPGFNDNARKRAIIMHGADFASEDYIKKHGILGTSWGCPAITDEVSDEVIELLKEGSLIFSYYPDKRWLGTSSFLNVD